MNIVQRKPNNLDHITCEIDSQFYEHDLPVDELLMKAEDFAKKFDPSYIAKVEVSYIQRGNSEPLAYVHIHNYNGKRSETKAFYFKQKEGRSGFTVHELGETQD